MVNIWKYMKYGAIAGGVIGTAIATYDVGKEIIPLSYQAFPNTFYMKNILAVTSAGVSLVWGAVIGGIPAAAVGAASGAVIGGAKKGLEAIVGSHKS